MRPNRRLLLLSVTIVAAAFSMIAAIPFAFPILYHGNVESRIYHQPGCREYHRKKCTAAFKSRQAAEKAGYRPCKVCEP